MWKGILGKKSLLVHGFKCLSVVLVATDSGPTVRSEYYRGGSTWTGGRTGSRKRTGDQVLPLKACFLWPTSSSWAPPAKGSTASQDIAWVNTPHKSACSCQIQSENITLVFSFVSRDDKRPPYRTIIERKWDLRGQRSPWHPAYKKHSSISPTIQCYLIDCAQWEHLFLHILYNSILLSQMSWEMSPKCLSDKGYSGTPAGALLWLFLISQGSSSASP